MASLGEFIRAQFANLPIAMAPEICKGRVYIVTGSNTGIGREAVKHLVARGASRVIMGVRSREKGDAAREAIEAETGIRGVAEVWLLDMADFTSVRAFAARTARELARLDGVVLNATAALDTFTTSADGTMETSVAANVVGTLLLLLLMLPQLRSSAASTTAMSPAPHAVVVTSAMAFGYPQVMSLASDGNLFDKLNQQGGPSHMHDRYGITKGLQIMAVRWLTTKLLPPERSGGVVVNLLSPGLCNTGVARYGRLSFRVYNRLFNMAVGRTPEMGSRTILHAMVAGKESHGCLVSDCEIKDYWIPEWLKDDEGWRIQERVWTQLASRLEAIEPGVIARATNA